LLLLLLLLVVLVKVGEVTPAYIAAFKKLLVDLEATIGDCQFSFEGMSYRNNTKGISSSNVFFPAGVWLRGFFHDAGEHRGQQARSNEKNG
jgi:hypothetical protein